MAKKRKPIRLTDLLLPPDLLASTNPNKRQSPLLRLLSRQLYRSSILSYSMLGLVIATGAIDMGVRSENPVWISVSIAAPITIAVILAEVWRRDFVVWSAARRWQGSLELKLIDTLQGHEFESACAEMYRRIGYSVEVTKRSRDQGADIIMKGIDGTVVVQVKRQASAVGNWAVQEVCAAKGLYRASQAVVVTNSTFTKQAVELAQANSVLLVDREVLGKLMASAAGQGKPRLTWSDVWRYVLHRFRAS